MALDVARLGDWQPSDSGPWRTVLDEETACVHVMPAFGPPHAYYPLCWCHPVSSADELNRVLHNVAQ